MEPERSRWQQIKMHPVRAVLIAFLAVVIVLTIMSILGYILNWDWTGLGAYVSPPHSQDSDFQRGKTLWDWLQLLIIPAVLAIAGYIINLTISRGEQAATEQRAKSERDAAEKRADTERKIAEDNQRETALQEYINKMSELLLHENLRLSKPEDETRNMGRVRTLTVLPRLNSLRRGAVLLFLYESGLLHEDTSIISLRGADLSGAELNKADLHGADLSRVNLSGARLSRARLNRAKMRGANLSGACLSGANLHRADLSGANLLLADLSNVNITGATVADAQLTPAKSLLGATMPDGSKHPWSTINTYLTELG